jgi:hypothetical protein
MKRNSFVIKQRGAKMKTAAYFLMSLLALLLQFSLKKSKPAH